jgi:hypothetical protein
MRAPLGVVTRWSNSSRSVIVSGIGARHGRLAAMHARLSFSDPFRFHDFTFVIESTVTHTTCFHQATPQP